MPIGFVVAPIILMLPVYGWTLLSGGGMLHILAAWLCTVLLAIVLTLMTYLCLMKINTTES